LFTPLRRGVRSEPTSLILLLSNENDMNQLEIRVMTYRDINFVMRLQEIAGWGNTRADIERSLYYEPSGCFAASINGVDVGIVNSFLYGDVGFIGNLIVVPESRGCGVGAALMKKAMERLMVDGACSICLDGVQKAISLYERLGFKSEYWSLRFTGLASKGSYHGVEPMVREDLEQVARLDRRFFGLDRDQKLRRVQNDFPDLCFKASKSGEIQGFIMAKLGASNVRVGPWIWNPDFGDLAEPLLNALTSKVEGRKIWVGVPEFNEASVKIVEGKGYDRMPASLRMCYGAFKKVENVFGIFGIGAPDKG
jgi:ribosomal protein S18 acetylase RimI-like enzyme